MYGVSAAPASSFGKAPGGFGGFGITASTNTNTSMAADGGFSAVKGFGAPSTAPTYTTPSFGAAPASAATTGAPMGFGAASGGFGGGGGGFGTAAPAFVTGFGTPSTGAGFGAPSGTAGGWPPFGGSFVALQQQQQQQPVPQPTVTLQDFTRQSALASYLVQLDQSYNALHPKCHFTTFVYNSCGPGQMMDAIQKERYTAYLNGGGCSDEAYMQALKKNPDPGRLYPSPLHFAQELLARTKKQKDAIVVLHKKVIELLQDVATVAAMDAANVQRQREGEQEELMLRHRWYALLRKMELLRRSSCPDDGEASLLRSRVEQLRQHLHAPGHFSQLLGELRPYLREETSRVAMMAQQRPASPAPNHTAADSVSSPAFHSSSGRPLLRSEVDPYIMKDWIHFARQMQDGIETLDELLKTDLKEMRAIRERVESS